MNRAENSGTAMAKAIIEMVELMYQKNTQKNFYKGFLNEINIAIKEVNKAVNGNKTG